MTQEEKQLLLKDLCARLLYEVILLSPNNKITYQTDGNTAAELLIEEGWKPYLRPMSSMTEEERDEVEEISHGWFYINEDGEIYPMGRLTDCGEFEDAILPTFEYFMKNHIDYRCLIDRGLAIEAPEGMYNLKK